MFDDVGCEPVQSDTELSNTHTLARAQAIIWHEVNMFLIVDTGSKRGRRCVREKKWSQTTKKVKHRLMQINSSDLCIANWYIFIYSFLSWVFVCFPFLSFYNTRLGCVFFLSLSLGICCCCFEIYINRYVDETAWDADTTIPSFIRNLFVRPSSIGCVSVCVCDHVGFVHHMRMRFRLYSFLFTFFLLPTHKFSASIQASTFFKILITLRVR